MINKKRNITGVLSEEEKVKALSYVFGCYGADRPMPHAYKEENWHVAPGKCTCVVMNRTCGEVVYDHVSRYFGSSIDQMRTWKYNMEDTFELKYIQKNSSDIKRLDHQTNLNFGNFALSRIDTILKQDYIMVFPYSIIDCSLNTSLAALETYFISHGIIPDKASRYTAQAFASAASMAMAIEGNTLSGIYAFERIAMRDGSAFIGLSKSDNGVVLCHFQKKLPDGKLENRSCPLANLGIDEMQRLLPAISDFHKKFKRFLPSFKNETFRQAEDNSCKQNAGLGRGF